MFAPLTKVFGLQRSKFLVVGFVSHLLSYLNLFSIAFLESSGIKKSRGLKWLVSLLKPFKQMQKINRAKGLVLKTLNI